MKWFFFTSALFFSTLSTADFSDHLKREIGLKEQKKTILGLDYIYLINLDQRPEKWDKSLRQLAPYGITPHRFSAIYGWDLPTETTNELGVCFQADMQSDFWAACFPRKLKGAPEVDFLRKDLYGTSVFYYAITPGAIGCYLSHLSVLQDAYDSGYETIWVMEDDILVVKDPHLLSQYIQKLDNLLGSQGWDILYTDMDFDAEYFLTAVKENPRLFWRPDMISTLDYQHFLERKVLSEDFLQIGGRFRTHSMIIRRSGVKKILEHAKKYHIYLPYDHDIAVIPGIRCFNLRANVVTVEEISSDTHFATLIKRATWEKYRKEVLEELPKITGWNHVERADRLMQFLYDCSPNLCVEIGSFGGSTTYQIAKTLSFLKKGKLYAIDSWNVKDAIEGISQKDLIEIFQSLDMKAIQKQCQNLLSSQGLTAHCTLIEENSKQAASRFTDGSIDFLYIDGNPSKKGSLADVTAYLPKVKKGGYICLNDTNRLEKAPSIAFLLSHCTWLKEEFGGMECLLFQKK